MIAIETPYESKILTAKAFKVKRQQMKHSRDEASRRTGVPAPTLRKFEDSGDISFRQFLMLLAVYGELSCLENSFPAIKASTMDELANLQKRGAE
jgi:hypothetical protein